LTVERSALKERVCEDLLQLWNVVPKRRGVSGRLRAGQFGTDVEVGSRTTQGHKRGNWEQMPTAVGGGGGAAGGPVNTNRGRGKKGRKSERGWADGNMGCNGGQDQSFAKWKGDQSKR